MSMEYVRKTYGVPAKRGGRVKFNFKCALCYGRILSATNYVRVEPDEAPGVRLSFHPTDLTYL
jgi:hypothetical protein